MGEVDGEGSQEAVGNDGRGHHAEQSDDDSCCPKQVVTEEDDEVDDVGPGHDLGDLERLNKGLLVHPFLLHNEDLTHVGQESATEAGGTEEEGRCEELGVGVGRGSLPSLTVPSVHAA
ncbi:unannotated protein [freshwater metagenome]|uniref:Unannotated protein n=1 Tax=freshwater metagenome TaxID=449393 RepID=A0A6J6XAV0_9ZZZZ